MHIKLLNIAVKLLKLTYNKIRKYTKKEKGTMLQPSIKWLRKNYECVCVCVYVCVCVSQIIKQMA
jgi:hypothetical protein